MKGLYISISQMRKFRHRAQRVGKNAKEERSESSSGPGGGDGGGGIFLSSHSSQG